jgi:hypothetical protein
MVKKLKALLQLCCCSEVKFVLKTSESSRMKIMPHALSVTVIRRIDHGGHVVG